MTVSDPFIGTMLGSYEVLEAVGEGGMARIYKGFHAELNRYAAIKVVNWGLQEDPEFTERFRREAQAIASLRHPNIVQIFDFGRHDSGYYMAMEFIDGSDFAVLLQEAKTDFTLLPKETVIRMVKEVGAALDYAHAHDVIHRDVKPSNIMVNREGQAILADFGLVMLSAQSSQMTMGNTFGTPHYVAPEQAISSASAVPASDIYSLGVVLYEMTTGELPFDDESPLSIALKHVSDTPPPPTSINPELSKAVEDVILKTMSKDPAGRYATASDVALALESAWNDGVSERENDKTVPIPPIPADVAEVAATISSVDAPGNTHSQQDSSSNEAIRRKSVLMGWPLMLVIAAAGILIGAFAIFFFNNGSVFSTPTPTTTSTAVLVVAQPTNTPTPTPEPPTDTPTPTPSPTNTDTPTPTPEPPTDTPTPTSTNTPVPPTPTSTTTPTPTNTPTTTSTPLPLPTPTPEGLSSKVLFKTDRAGFVEIYQMNADGSNQRPLEDLSIYTELEAALPFSTDRQNQVLVRGEGQLDLWWKNLANGQELRITSTGSPEYDPAWSPVDNRIVYVSEETGNGDIYMLNLGGSSLVRLTDNIENFDKHPTWSPDGEKVAFWSDMSFNHNRQIWVVDLKTKELTSLSDNPFNDWDPVWVP